LQEAAKFARDRKNEERRGSEPAWQRITQTSELSPKAARLAFGPMSYSLAAQGKNFRIRKYARRLLRSVKDAIHHGIIRGNAVLFQPEKDIGFSAHGADLDH
jgi:hypothetical protein